MHLHDTVGSPGAPDAPRLSAGPRGSGKTEYSAYIEFPRDEWAKLRSSTPLTLSEEDLTSLRGVTEQVSMADVVDVYLPLSRLLNLHFRSARSLGGVKDEFLGRLVGNRPYVIGIAGSVAVGKSTFARVLQALLGRWPDHPRVALITSDGFLHSNRVLQERGLMRRKGFPESYDRRLMVEFLADTKAGKPEVRAPVYSHRSYDIMDGEWQAVTEPDILIFEGLNVLQTGSVDPGRTRTPSVIVSDFFDFSIYVDADDAHIERWYIDRFLMLQRTVFSNPSSYFHHYKDLTLDDATRIAREIWNDINLANLRENILPTRERANVVLRKREDHTVGEVWLREI